MRAKTLLVLLLIGLQIADVATTNAALGMPGVREGNPLMAWAQGTLGAHWWLVKAAIAGVGILALAMLRTGWPLQFATAFYAVLVLGNILRTPMQ
jgi:hypothetical protein